MRKMLSKILALALCLALGLGLVGGAFAADEQTGTFDLEAVCTDDGQYVAKVVITLDQPIGEVDAKEVAEAFSVRVVGYDRNFYGFPIAGDFDRTVADAAVSEDGKTVTLNLSLVGAFPGSLSFKGDFADYCEGYEVKLTKDIGGLTTALKLTYGKMVDPVADKWGAVRRTETEYNYRFFTPDAETYKAPEAGYPLIVWLHGDGEAADDNGIQITANRVTAWGEKETQDLFGGAYVLAPQLPREHNISAGDGTGWNEEKVMSTIEAFIASVGNVDRDRIIIGGCSMGGMGTWKMIKAYPDYFAAAFPICGMVDLKGEDIVALKALPIYLIHTVEDMTVPIVGSLSAYDTLTGAGKTNIYLALYEHTWTPGTPDSTAEEIATLAYNGHSSWIYAHNDIDGEKEADKYFLDTFDYTVGEGEDAVTTTYKNTKPSELGYSSFKAWLAAQSKTGVRYTVGREVTAFGEVANSVTIHGLDRIRATIKTEDWLKDNKIEVTVLNTQIGANADGTPIMGDFVRTPESTVINSDRTSVTVKFANGNFVFDPDNGINKQYKVTLNGEEITYGGDTNADADKFEVLNYTVPAYNWRGTNMTTMSARAFTPDKETYAKPANGYPLVVWLHGGGEIGADNRIQITANDVPNWTEKETQDLFGGAYVLAPQNHAGASVPATMAVIEQFIAEKGDIDTGRIYVGGCSYGGIATWNMIRNYPDYFAAAFPICCGPSGGLNENEAKALADLPIYMTVSTGDSAGIVSGMIQAYNDLKAAGSECVWFSMFEHSWFDGYDPFVEAIGPVLDHWSWVYVHADYDAKGEDYDGVQFIDTSKDGEYNNGAVVVKDGVLTYTYTENETEKSISLEGQVSRPEDAGYATFKTWLAAQSTENHDAYPFVDVVKGDEIYDAVRTLWEKNITKGTGLNTFEPESTLTRAEFVTFLARVAGAEVDNTAETKFTDLRETWYVGSVAWAVEKGLIIGATDTTFEPYETLTQAQVNLILERNDSEPAFEAPEGTVTRAQAAEILVGLMGE